MKLICFPHYTAGGLLGDILQGTYSPVSINGGISSMNHSLGKIGDTDSIFENFSEQQFSNFFLRYKNKSIVIGTHCWPGNIDISWIEQVITITTETTKSKIYRWLRAWHLYFSKSQSIKNLVGLELIDKQRELAKNYLLPFKVVPDATNLEFADIVETTSEFQNFLNGIPMEKHLQRWKNINYFLYDSNLWNSNLVQRYYEAEFEVAHGRYYQYH